MWPSFICFISHTHNLSSKWTKWASNILVSLRLVFLFVDWKFGPAAAATSSKITTILSTGMSSFQFYWIVNSHRFSFSLFAYVVFPFQSFVWILFCLFLKTIYLGHILQSTIPTYSLQCHFSLRHSFLLVRISFFDICVFLRLHSFESIIIL